MPEQEQELREPERRIATVSELYRTVSLIPWEARTSDETEFVRTIAQLHDRLLPRLLRPGSVSNRERRLADPTSAIEPTESGEAAPRQRLNGASWSEEQEKRWRRETERRLVEAQKRQERRRAEVREVLDSLGDESRARLLNLFPWLETGL
jgi:hypothetical protein